MINLNRWLRIVVVLCITMLITQDIYSNNFFDNLKGLFKKENSVKKSKKSKSELVVVDTISNIYELTLSDNIYAPLLQAKAKNVITTKQQKLVDKLTSNGYSATTMRDGEVVKITIVTDKLFAPNDTILMDSASELIFPLVEYAKVDDYYKVMLAIHSDDTGSELYKSMICNARVDAIGSLFDGTKSLVSYAMSDTEPIFDNKSVKNRAANRRLEIYFVPYKVMIVKGEKGIL